VIKSAAATNINAKEYSTAFNTGEVFFISFHSFPIISWNACTLIVHIPYSKKV
jgi:hypothetical protein